MKRLNVKCSGREPLNVGNSIVTSPCRARSQTLIKDIQTALLKKIFVEKEQTLGIRHLSCDTRTHTHTHTHTLTHTHTHTRPGVPVALERLQKVADRQLQTSPACLITHAQQGQLPPQAQARDVSLSAICGLVLVYTLHACMHAPYMHYILLHTCIRAYTYMLTSHVQTHMLATHTGRR